MLAGQRNQNGHDRTDHNAEKHFLTENRNRTYTRDAFDGKNLNSLHGSDVRSPPIKERELTDPCKGSRRETPQRGFSQDPAICTSTIIVTRVTMIQDPRVAIAAAEMLICGQHGQDNTEQKLRQTHMFTPCNTTKLKT